MNASLQLSAAVMVAFGMDPIGLYVRTIDLEGEGTLVGHSQERAVYVDDEGDRWAPLAELTVSTAEAATRDRLVRWIRSRLLSGPGGSTAPGWGPAKGAGKNPVWSLSVNGGAVVFSAVPNGHHTPRAPRHVVPALADLDPWDPRALPDGSRLIDAIALAVVVRHAMETP